MNNIKIPKNGLYLTDEDFKSWDDYFSLIYINKNTDIDKTNAMNISFVVTERCNLRCTYCYESHEAHACGNIMTKETARKAVDFILDENKINGYFLKDEKPAVILEFIGGEALLEIDLIDYISDYFKLRAFELKHPWAINYVFHISTNGILYNTEKVQKYIKKNKNNVVISITVDGNKQLHDSCRVFPDGNGSYDIVKKAVLKNYNNTTVRTTKLTIAPENIEYIAEAFKNCWNELGCDMIYANCVFEDVWEEKHADMLFNELIKVANYLIDNNLYALKSTSIFVEDVKKVEDTNKNYCGGNGEMLAIGPDGVCYPCLRFMKHSMSNGRKPFVCGNIYDGLVDKNTDKALSELCGVTVLSQSPQKCLDCEVSAECGLCTAFNYDCFGTPNKRATYICDMHKARVSASEYFFKRLYYKLNLNGKYKIREEE